MQRANERRDYKPENGEFGYYAFAPDRTDIHVDEPNTESEDELLNALDRHVQDDSKLNVSDAAKIQDFLRNGWYEDVFNEPDVEFVYRGMTLDKETLENLISDKINPYERTGVIKRPAVFKPYDAVSSWTTMIDTAAGFASKHNKKLAVILVARVSANKDRFFSGPDGFYNVRRLSVFDDENEIIGIGTIDVEEIRWRSLA